MTHKIDNNITSIVQGALASDTTTITVKSGEGSLFPIPSYLTLEEFNSDNKCIKREIIEATSKNGDDITVTRAIEECVQDDTASTKTISNNALTFNDGTIISLYLTKGTLEEREGIKIEGEKSEKMVDEDKILILDSEDGKYKTLSKQLMCDSCQDDTIKDLTIYRQTNSQQIINFTKSYYDIENKTIYSSFILKNADGGTSDKYFTVLMKIDNTGNKILEKYIDIQLNRETDRSYLIEYNGFIYFIAFLDDANINGSVGDGILILKLDKDLGVIDNKFIKSVIDYRNGNIIDGNTLTSIIRRGSNQKYTVLDINLDDLTYTAKESADYYQYGITNDTYITKKGNEIYSIYYSGLFYNINTGILTQKDSSGEYSLDGIIRGNNITKLMGYNGKNILGFDENDNLIWSKTINNIDGVSLGSADNIQYIFYDDILDEYKVYVNFTGSNYFYILTFDNTYTYKHYEKITTLDVKTLINSVERIEGGYIISVSNGSNNTNTVQTIILQDTFVEGTFSDGTCEYIGSTNTITLDDYTQNITTSSVTLNDYTGTDEQVTLNLIDCSLNNYDMCSSTLS